MANLHIEVIRYVTQRNRVAVKRVQYQPSVSSASPSDDLRVLRNHPTRCWELPLAQVPVLPDDTLKLFS